MYTFLDIQRLTFEDVTITQKRMKIIVKIRNFGQGALTHSLPMINRCCKILPHEVVKFEGTDYIPRINHCTLSEKTFFSEFVLKREPIMLLGCQDTWKAKNWTFRGM